MAVRETKAHKHELARRNHGDNLLVGVAFGDEHVSAHRLGEETEAEHGGVIRRCYKAVVTRRRR
jgi:hypothetical protein